MTKLTIGRMAKLYGLHRSTLHEAVAKGRVTAVLDGKGQRVIDLAEMIRVYGEPSGKSTHNPTPSPDTLQALHPGVLEPLLEELRLLREEVRELRQSMLLLEHKPLGVRSAPRVEPQPQEPATWSSLFSALDD